MDDETFELAVARLNALGGEYQPWKVTQARKNHTDEFGQLIKSGEHYYNKSSGSAYDNVVKLSEKSMDSFAYLYFLNTPQLKDTADKIVKKRKEKLQKSLDSFNI